MANQIITPENIVNITFQYILPQSGIGNNSGVASIFVTFNDGNNRAQKIILQECKTYINYLQIRAAVEGKFVVATQFTDNRTVIGLSIVPEPVIINNRYDLFLDGTPFDPTNNLTDIINGTVLSNNSYRTDIIAAVASFTLPIIGDGTNFFNEYSIAVLPTNVSISAINNSPNWTIIFTSYNNAGIVENVNFVPIPQMIVENITSNSIINFSDGFTNKGILYGTSAVIPKTFISYESQPFQSPFVPAATKTSGYGFIIQYFNGATLLNTEYSANYTGALTLPLTCNHVIISEQGSLLGVDLVDDGIGGTSKINIFQMTQVLSGQCLANDGFNIHIFVKATGATAFAAAYNNALLVALSRADINEAIDTGVIGAFLIGTEYVVNISFVNQVSGLTTQTYSITAVCAAAPPVTKNVFVLNTSANPIVVTTNTASYPFAAGGSGNVLCTPGGICKNDSLTAQTFTFLQSLPATLAPLEAPNPQLLGIGATHNLNANINTLNYIKVS